MYFNVGDAFVEQAACSIEGYIMQLLLAQKFEQL